MEEDKLLDLLSSVKTMVKTDPAQARTVLTGHPNLAYALMKEMVTLDVVDPDVLTRTLQAAAAPQIQAQPSYAPTPPAPAPAPVPPSIVHQPPPARAPPPPPLQPQPQATGPPPMGLAPEQQAMIQRLAMLTPEQIAALPPSDRAALLELRRQLGLS